MIGEVYFLQAEKGPIKIGFSLDVPKRIAGIQAGMREILTLLGRIPGDRRTEYFFHKTLAAHRIGGEWFFPDPPVLELVSRAIAEGLSAVHPDYRPLPEYESAAVDDGDDILRECRDYCVLIAGERVGSEKIRDLIARAAKLTGLTWRKIAAIWYREKPKITASDYIAIKSVFEGREAVRLDRLRRESEAAGMLRKLVGAQHEHH